MVTRRTPVWKQKQIIHALTRVLLRPINYSWLLAVIQGTFLIGASYWFQRPPSSGVAVVILGLVAIVMAIRAEEKWGRSERMAWLLLGVVLASVAIRAIRKEDDERDRQFATIVKGLETTIQTSSQQFKEEMEKSNAIMTGIGKVIGLSEESIGSVTGGDSFVYFRLLPEPSNPTLTQVWEIHHGRYPIRDVLARVVDIDQMMKAIAIKPFDLNAIRRADIAYVAVPMLTPIHSTIRLINYTLGGTDHHSFNIFFVGPNGDWSEQLREQFVNGMWVGAVRVMQQRDGEKPRFFYDMDSYPIKQKDMDWDH